MTSPSPYEMPPYVIDRVMKKRGRLRVFERFEPRETALVVIDMQKFYVSDVPPAVAIVPHINKLAATFRARGGHVAWVSMTAGDNGRSLWPIYHDYFFTKENAARHRDNLTAGADGHRIYPTLDVQPGDIMATKSRFSAFIPSRSDLPEKLTAAGITNVVIVGMLTNMCCETSARDAMMLDFRVVMVSDANAARFIEDHNIGFSTVFQSFGDVLTTDEVIDDLVLEGTSRK
ncbi:cysteine hydrolase [Bradyrhizobium barranii]|uniref:Cysteine hydrolase n=1 Tax=Bradyrhizobium barranii TaxID=2992140 RepID=A0ABY3QVK9_9BRAD|nr:MULTISPECIES: cysteine hydrolase [Bradyrhizobium]UFW90055.1 cysteine hydrolase [Bradyrhizobium japonicum]CUU19683.1 Nicotinamidaseisochorismatase family protein CDS [Bradyrhizobium sp.]